MSVKEETREKTRIKIKEPKHYRVIMHNDDFTSMEFVVEVLVCIFTKKEMEAQQLMLMIHRNGRAIVGFYPYDIAVSKVRKATEKAREEGFPLRITIEEV